MYLQYLAQYKRLTRTRVLYVVLLTQHYLQYIVACNKSSSKKMEYILYIKGCTRDLMVKTRTKAITTHTEYKFNNLIVPNKLILH